MKKRKITETAYPITREEFKLLSDEEKQVRIAANKEYLASNHYTVNDFPKQRYYVVLAKCKETGVICGWNDAAPDKALSTSQVLIYKTPRSRFRNRDFRLKEYRKFDYTGHYNACHYARNLFKRKGSEKFEIFVARVGSKNCPIKVKIRPELKNQIRATFCLK